MGGRGGFWLPTAARDFSEVTCDTRFNVVFSRFAISFRQIKKDYFLHLPSKLWEISVYIVQVGENYANVESDVWELSELSMSAITALCLSFTRIWVHLILATPVGDFMFFGYWCLTTVWI